MTKFLWRLQTILSHSHNKLGVMPNMFTYEIVGGHRDGERFNLEFDNYVLLLFPIIRNDITRLPIIDSNDFRIQEGDLVRSCPVKEFKVYWYEGTEKLYEGDTLQIPPLIQGEQNG